MFLTKMGSRPSGSDDTIRETVGKRQACENVNEPKKKEDTRAGASAWKNI